MRRIPLCEPVLRGNEGVYLAECIESGYVSTVGPFVQRFEEAFARRVGARHAVACSSGTAALHVALVVTGAKPGTTVPVSTFTFVASVNAVAYTGATPLLVDSEPVTWNMDSERLHEHVLAWAAAGKPLPPTIEVVHILGVPADMEPLIDLRSRFGIRIVEDAAESLGASFSNGASVGTLGDVGCFSFNGNKVITAGGGGMIVTDDVELAERCRHLTTQAKLPGSSYQHDEIGFNYRLTNLAAAVGLAQLEQLDQFLAAKKSSAERYRSALSGIDAFSLPEPHNGATSSDWLFSMLDCVGNRDQLVDDLSDAGIGARPVWWPAHLQQPHLRSPRIGGECAERLGAQGFSVPSSADVTDDEIEHVIEQLLTARGH